MKTILKIRKWVGITIVVLVFIGTIAATALNFFFGLAVAKQVTQLEVSTEYDIGQTTATLRNIQAEIKQSKETQAGRLDDFEAKIIQMEKELAVVAAENADLKELVTELELEKLTPFHATGFQCTRSMIPAIDCGDEAVWKKKEFLNPEDITVGKIIAFHLSTECEGFEKISTAHRVLKIKKGEGETLYKTQGDNNPMPDPCWIPFSDVVALLMLVREDARPQDIRKDITDYDKALKELRKLQREYQETQEQYEAVLDAFHAKQKGFVAEYTELCGFPPDGTHQCSLPEAQFLEMQKRLGSLNELWFNVEKMGSELQELLSRIRKAEKRLKKESCKAFSLSCMPQP